MPKLLEKMLFIDLSCHGEILLHTIQSVTRNYQNLSETSAIHRDSGNNEENFVINCAFPIKNVGGKTMALKIKEFQGDITHLHHQTD